MRLTDETRKALWEVMAETEELWGEYWDTGTPAGKAPMTLVEAVERVLLCGKAVNVKYDSAGNPSYELRIPIIRGN